MAKTVNLIDAFTAGFLLEHSFKETSRYPIAGYTEEEMRDRLRPEFEAWLGEDVPEAFFIHGNGDNDTDEPKEGEEVLDLDMCYTVLDQARQELVEQAFAGNITRSHHLESAVACFQSIGVLFSAERIVRESLDPRDEPEAPTEA